MILREPAVWFPTVRTGTGTDVFTETLVVQLQKRGIRAEITWLPLRAECVPFTVPVPKPPEWATVAHVNTWLNPRFLPKHLATVATIHHSVHHPNVTVYKGAIRAAYHRFWIAPNERRVLRSVDRVVACSRFVAETTRQTLIGIPLEVIHNGVDTSIYCPGERKRSPAEPFRLLYVGGWKRLKGVDLLAQIMRHLGAGFQLRYTGGPGAAADRTHMPNNARDLGRLRGVDAVIDAMQDADALLFPSRSEGFPLTVIEAMACGLPVIATRGSSLGEAVDDGRTGLLCAQDDVRAFASACRRLSEDPVALDAMSLAARMRAVERFSLDRMVDSYEAQYRADRSTRTVVMRGRSDPHDAIGPANRKWWSRP